MIRNPWKDPWIMKLKSKEGVTNSVWDAWVDALKKSMETLTASTCSSWSGFLGSSSEEDRSALSTMFLLSRDPGRVYSTISTSTDPRSRSRVFELFASFPTVKWGVNGLVIVTENIHEMTEILFAVASLPQLDRLAVIHRSWTTPQRRVFSDPELEAKPFWTETLIEKIRQVWDSNASLEKYIRHLLLNGEDIEGEDIDGEDIDGVHLTGDGWTETGASLAILLVLQSTRTSFLALHFETSFIHNMWNIYTDMIIHRMLGVLLRNASLKHFYYYYPYIDIRSDDLENFVSNHPSLLSLRLSAPQISGRTVHCIFDSLTRSRRRITSLSLECDHFQNCSIPRVVDALRRCPTFHNLHLLGHPLQDDPSIAAQLEKNRTKSKIEQYLTEAGERPSTVRLYLCGLPFSGKTSIQKSLLNCSPSASYIRKLGSISSSSNQVSRTRGINVTVLLQEGQINGSTRISIWDMAGQAEFHAFHDSMLPDMCSNAISPLFLFVWSPLHLDRSGKTSVDEDRRRIVKTKDEFMVDFRYWLKFVASKVSPTESFKPKFLLAITRKDLLNNQNMSTCLKPELEFLDSEFRDHIDLHIENGVFEIDATNPKSLASLHSYIFAVAMSILDEAPLEIRICEKTRRFLKSSIDHHQLPPIIDKQELQQILCAEDSSLKSSELFDVVCNCLATSADIIYYSSVDLVILDIQWFCRKIMGDLLQFNVKSDINGGQNGFFRSENLANLLEKHVNKPKRLFSRSMPHKVEGRLLVQLLLCLRLACKMDYQQHDLFVPVSLSGTKRRETILQSEYSRPSESSLVVGRRLSVKDTLRTFLTPGVFPLLQVTFYNHLNPEVVVKLKQDLIAFSTDGAEVLVELCRMEGRDDFIDVLVSFQNSSVDDAIEWMEENLLRKMRKVFAESRGIPGAEITYGVIRPACIKSSVGASARSVVSKDRLRNILRQNLEKRGSRIVDNGTINLTFTWQTTPPTHDPLQSLLGSAEVMKIVKDYEEFLKDATYFANPGLIDIDVSPSESSSSEIREDAREHDFGESPSSKELGYIYNAFRGDMEKNFQQVNRNLEIVKSDLKTLMDQVKILLCQVEDLRSTVLSGLQKIFRYLEESEAGALPRIFVLAEDDGTVRRLVTKLIPTIHYYKLHLLCECPNEQVHFLEDGYGLQISALDDDALLKRGLPYLKTLLKIASIAVKVSAHAAAGAGELVPDFTKMLSASSLDFEGSSELPTRSNLQEGHQWLRDVLKRRNCLGGEEIHRTFGLRRIRCRDGRVSWVCDAHYFMGKPYPA